MKTLLSKGFLWKHMGVLEWDIPVVQWRVCIYSQINTNSKDQVGKIAFYTYLLLML